MDNVSFIDIETLEGVVKYAIIDRGNGEFTSMTKAHYEAQQLELSTEIIPGEAEQLTTNRKGSN